MIKYEHDMHKKYPKKHNKWHYVYDLMFKPRYKWLAITVILSLMNFSIKKKKGAGALNDLPEKRLSKPKQNGCWIWFWDESNKGFLRWDDWECED